MNLDLRFVCNWLKANKISLNASKTEMLVFRDPRRKIDFELKIRIDGKKITPSKFVKYLGIYLDHFLSWQKHTFEIYQGKAKTCFCLSGPSPWSNVPLEQENKFMCTKKAALRCDRV